jgi:hypothetical protein
MSLNVRVQSFLVIRAKQVKSKSFFTICQENSHRCGGLGQEAAQYKFRILKNRDSGIDIFGCYCKKKRRRAILEYVVSRMPQGRRKVDNMFHTLDDCIRATIGLQNEIRIGFQDESDSSGGKVSSG